MDIVERAARALAEMDTERDIGWRYYVPEARAVLTAIREPSVEQLAAGMDQGPIGCCILEGPHAFDIWQAMIDAAINPSAPQ